MKEIGKIEKWIVSILMLFVAVIIGAGILLPYLQVDLSGPISLVAAVSQPVANVFNYLTEFLGNEAGRLTFSALTLLKLTMGKFSGDFPEAAVALKSIKLIILIPYIIVILCFIFAFFRRTWSCARKLSVAFAMSCSVISTIRNLLFFGKSGQHSS